MPVVLNLKKLSTQEELFTGGHRLCPGCAAGIIARQVLHAAQAAGFKPVVASATGCLEVASTIFPYTAWRVPWIHNAFENAASTISGVEAAYKALLRVGKIKDKTLKFIAFGGDGGTYDIGLQALSGAAERGHDILYICYNNEAYMNTGIQRSSATPKGAWTTTSPAGTVIPGKPQHRKNLTEVMAAHEIPYVAQASPSNYMDFMRKVVKALETPGPAFINVISPCQRGWRYPARDTIKIARLAVETCLWPLYEVFYGRKWVINYKPREKKPVEEYIKAQGRFRHLAKNSDIIKQIQEWVDEEWASLLRKEEATKEVQI